MAEGRVVILFRQTEESSNIVPGGCSGLFTEKSPVLSMYEALAIKLHFAICICDEFSDVVGLWNATELPGYPQVPLLQSSPKRNGGRTQD